jgi:hypothetical protein
MRCSKQHIRVAYASLPELSDLVPSQADVQARLDRHAEIDANRRQHPRGGSKWTKELDGELVRRFDTDQPISDIAKALGRSTGGIRARLEKLGKLDRTPDRR